VSVTAIRWKQLARRTGDGVEATLLWDESIRRIKVTVSDERLCHHLDFDVDGAGVMSAFSGAFADAAAGVFVPPRREEIDD
jgi:hypothetical protein